MKIEVALGANEIMALNWAMLVIKVLPTTAGNKDKKQWLETLRRSDDWESACIEAAQVDMR